jgi:hypothetical protein
MRLIRVLTAIAVLILAFPVMAQQDCAGTGQSGIDQDGDGYCAPPEGIDCNDLDASVNPAAVEVCDSIDNNCNLLIDEGDVCGPDTDNDGTPDSEDADDDNDGIVDIVDIDSLDPFVCTDADSDTCDDCAVGTDGFGPLADNNPSNDGLDTDGDGICDAGDSDADNDGFPFDQDCNDTDPTTNPAAQEQCDDGVDNDCDGQIDEGCGPAPPPPSSCDNDTETAIRAAREYQQTTRIVGRSCAGNRATAISCSASLADQLNAYLALIQAQSEVEQNCQL